MKKMTIVTDAQGNLVGAIDGHNLTAKQGKVEATVSFPQGYKLNKVEVDEDMTKVTDAAAFQSRLLKYLPKS
jgi:hypothetical protein